jgi:hypothetical protein
MYVASWKLYLPNYITTHFCFYFHSKTEVDIFANAEKCDSMISWKMSGNSGAVYSQTLIQNISIRI